ncbi:MAG: anti-sigma factor family protein, partial [Acidimicrobiales bacterium]
MTGLDPNRHLGDLLSALLDAELLPAEEAIAVEHLRACRQCSIELEQIRAARSWVRALPQIEPPLGFIERLVREQGDNAAEPWYRRGWAARWAGVAAAAATAAAAVS